MPPRGFADDHAAAARAVGDAYAEWRENLTNTPLCYAKRAILYVNARRGSGRSLRAGGRFGKFEPFGAEGDVRPSLQSLLLRQAAFWEALVWLALCASWIWLVSLGEGNGFGFFHQPRNDITIPLIVGGIINAATFWAHAFYAIPRFLRAGAWRAYLAVVVLLFFGNVVLQTLTQSAIIRLAEPTLWQVTTWELLIENSYMPPFVLILSALYRFARDWALHLRERRALEERATTLEHALRAVNDDTADFLLIGAGRETLQIPIGTIKYLKAAGNYIEIVTTGRTHLAYGALKNVANDLPARRFARIHRSYVIGLDHVSSIKGDAVEIQSEQLPIGAGYKKAFMMQWGARAVVRRT